MRGRRKMRVVLHRRMRRGNLIREFSILCGIKLRPAVIWLIDSEQVVREGGPTTLVSSNAARDDFIALVLVLSPKMQRPFAILSKKQT